MADIFGTIVDFAKSTQIPQQFHAVDVKGLFTNFWFMIPFVSYIAYLFYKQALNSLVIIALVVFLWIFSGSSLMHGLVVNGEIQIGKILPVAGVFICAIAVAVYFLFMRSD